jgi:[protein-PII] uridylyltransferase
VLVTPTGYEVLTLSAGSPPATPAFRHARLRPEPAGRHDPAHDLTTQHALRAPTRRQGGAAGHPWPPAAPPPAACAVLLHKLSRLADTTLRGLCGSRPVSPAVCAAGGGRLWPCELFPIPMSMCCCCCPTTSRPTPTRLKAQLEGFIGSCWDAGLEIGSSVRTVSECLAEAAKDVTVQTSLLEVAPDHGPRAVCADFQRSYRAMDPQGFFRRQDAGDAPAPQQVTRTRPTHWSPTARSRPAACATCRSSCGWPRRPAWARTGTSWPQAAWPPVRVRQIKRNEALLRLIRARLHLLGTGARTGWCSTCRRRGRVVWLPLADPATDHRGPCAPAKP